MERRVPNTLRNNRGGDPLAPFACLAPSISFILTVILTYRVGPSCLAHGLVDVFNAPNASEQATRVTCCITVADLFSHHHADISTTACIIASHWHSSESLSPSLSLFANHHSFTTTMGVLHPFSAASKPMQDWDAMPSRPLPFAATLHTLDLNAQPAASSSKIPRPRRHDVPSDTPPRPTPASTSMHARYGSVSTSPYRTPLLSSPSARRPEVGSDDWMQMMVAHCVDNAKCDLELS